MGQLTLTRLPQAELEIVGIEHPAGALVKLIHVKNCERKGTLGGFTLTFPAFIMLTMGAILFYFLSHAAGRGGTGLGKRLARQ